MCDFKPGDEVVCVDNTGWGIWVGDVPIVGQTYRVLFVHIARGRPHLLLEGMVNCPRPERVNIGYRASRFRKVQPRDLSAWLKTAVTDTDHLDKPIKTPARPKVDALLKRVQSGAFG